MVIDMLSLDTQLIGSHRRASGLLFLKIAFGTQVPRDWKLAKVNVCSLGVSWMAIKCDGLASSEE